MHDRTANELAVVTKAKDLCSYVLDVVWLSSP